MVIAAITMAASLTMRATAAVDRDVTEGVESTIFTTVEEMPHYPGGQAGLLRHLAQNIQYPADAAEKGIHGRVIVKFVITKEGEVTRPEIQRSVYPSLDKEALRVVQTLHRFVPGKKNGEPVNVRYLLPVTFKLKAQ